MSIRVHFDDGTAFDLADAFGSAEVNIVKDVNTDEPWFYLPDQAKICVRLNGTGTQTRSWKCWLMDCEAREWQKPLPKQHRPANYLPSV